MSGRFFLAGGAILALLAGCAPQETARSEPVAPPAGPDACGASRVAAYLGAAASDETLTAVREGSGARTVRVVGPNDAMTMDYREDRLTITTGEDGRIKTLRCV